MQAAKYENIIFYLDITDGTVKKKEIVKVIVNFIKTKKKSNPLTLFGVLIIKDDKSPSFISNVGEAEEIIKKIEIDWKERNTDESFLENGLFYCLSQISEVATKQSAEHRVIVISDLPSNKSDDYQTALIELVKTVRFLPTYIDIIRLGEERFYSDDVKLRIITNHSNGGLFYCEDLKTLESVLLALTKSKRLAILNQPEGNIYIDEGNKTFYENLATELLTPENGEKGICILCNNEIIEDHSNSDMEFLKCYNCNSFFHKSHAAIYSFEQNIGLPHIFRCPRCDVLLKLDETTVLEINGITSQLTIQNNYKINNDPNCASMSNLQFEENIEENNIMTDNKESIENPTQVENEIENDSQIETKKTKTKTSKVPLTPSGFNFFINPSGNNNQSIQNKPISNEEGNLQKNKPQSEDSIQYFNSPEKSKKRRRTSKFKLCTICGETNGPFDKICKNCNASL